MRRALVLCVPFVLLVGCAGGDDRDAVELGDDPTLEECVDVLRQIMESVQVPDGVDPQDGMDEDEQSKADAALEAAFDDAGVDPSAEDDPCAQHAGPEAQAAKAEVMDDLDPDVAAMLAGSQVGT